VSYVTTCVVKCSFGVNFGSWDFTYHLEAAARTWVRQLTFLASLCGPENWYVPMLLINVDAFIQLTQMQGMCKLLLKIKLAVI
jgi:hypothetical protein